MGAIAPVSSALDASAPSAAQRSCAMCAATLAGPYCHACGQPSRAAQRPLREALLGQTGRMWHTVRTLVARPGELAREIDEARDRASVRPLTLLLHIIALFFLLSSLTDFRLQAMEQSDKSGRMRETLERRAGKAGVLPEVYTERVERKFQSTYTLLIALSSMVYAGVLAAAHRRSRKPWLVHVAAAIHFMCVVFLIALVAFLAGRALGWPTFNNYIVWGAVNVVAYAYFAPMIRRIYGEPWPRVLAKSALVLVAGSLSDMAMFVVSLNTAILLA